MAKVECFDADGKMHMKEPVDARECVQHCGFTMPKSEQKRTEISVNIPIGQMPEGLAESISKGAKSHKGKK